MAAASQEDNFSSARTGGYRRMIKVAGKRVPGREPSLLIPVPAIGSYNSRGRIMYSSMSPHVRSMSTENHFANRAAALFCDPEPPEFPCYPRAEMMEHASSEKDKNRSAFILG